MVAWAIRFALLAGAVLYLLAGRPRAVAAAEPVDWHREPVQTAAERAAFTLATRQGEVTLRPRARYDVAAVVASKEPYWLDATAFLSPFDLALAWGEVPAPPLRDRLRIGQSWRFFFWRTDDPAVDIGYVIRHTANTHVIPASRNVRRALAAVGRGDAVRLQGWLVDVASERGLTWRTSLTRDDHGDRGCEILWVESLQVGDRYYE
jgi:hypothetical protein